jgi:hypothetical protein
LAPDDGASKKGKCPKCNHLLVVPLTTKGRPAINTDVSEQLQQAKEAIATATLDPAKYSPDEVVNLYGEKPGWLVPTYDKLSLFLMAVTWILLFIMNNKLNKTIQNFLLARNWPLTIYVLTMPAIFLVIGVYQIFIKREKSDFEKTMMLWFAIVTNVLTGIFAAVYIIENADVRNWQIIFPMWNLANAVILYLMLVADVIDENCIIDREAKPVQVVFGIVATVTIILFCNYVLKLHWAITFSICIVYTTSFDRALQNILPGFYTSKEQVDT